MNIASDESSIICPMKTTTPLACLLMLATLTTTHANWPAWRGPLANGVAPQADPPTEWSETKNVKWKVKLPGQGTATPIVWGDKIFILTAIVAEKPAESAAAKDSSPPNST